MRRLASILWLFLLLGQLGWAQEELQNYLETTDHIVSQHQENISEFLHAIAPHRETNNVEGLKAETDRYLTVSMETITKLREIDPPGEAAKYHTALIRLFEVQRETTTLLSNILDDRLVLLNELELMKEEGASQEEREIYAATNAPDQAEMVSKTTQLQTENSELNAFLKQERERLAEQTE